MVALPIPNTTTDKIYKLYEKPEPNRSYLGMSQMGNPCDRALWLTFRWAGGDEDFSGRMKRLFMTGHREELRMLEELVGVGITLKAPKEGEDQHGVVALDGHFRGHLDGIGTGFEEAPKAEHVLEFKTHNEKSFKDLVSKGVKSSKPAHFNQVQLYMHFTGIQRAFYLAVNKNTDELYQERIAYDEVEALRLVARAERIIKSATMPSKLSDRPDHWECRFCKHHAFCHHPAGLFSRRTCRTCLSSTPVQGGFLCDVKNTVNDVADQCLGCDKHLYIPDLVPGEQVDADEATRTVTYKLHDAKVFIDGGKNV